MKRSAYALLCSVLLTFVAGAAESQEILSIQLVGNIGGITCDPEDSANNMECLGDSTWRKLVFVDQPGCPDTVFFKFTKNGSYLPLHWGWSGVWGIAEFSWNPPSIAAILPDSGYHHIFFRASDYRYWIERPSGSISGALLTDGAEGLPPGASVTLFDSLCNVIGTYTSWSDETYHFNGLCASVYQLSAHAPGYRDTVLSDIRLEAGETKDIPIRLTSLVGVLIASAQCRRIEGGVMVTWSTSAGSAAAFDVLRAFEPSFPAAEKRNTAPVVAGPIYEFFDSCEDPTKNLYYYLVELGSDHPTRYGPIFVKGQAVVAFLGQNYPNPFNPATTIPFIISAAGAGKPVTISFYDAAGRLADRYELGVREPGNHTFRWNPTARHRGDFPSGVYYCRLRIGGETFTRKMILLR
jgi:hypothetical protein